MADIFEKYPFLKGFKQVTEEEFEELIFRVSSGAKVAFVATDKNRLTHLFIDGGRKKRAPTDKPWLAYFASTMDEYLAKSIALLIGFNEEKVMQKLVILRTGLTQMPQNIGQLQGLIELNLMSNQLKELPQNIGQLQELTELYLFQNQLNELPQSIEQLQKLQIFDIDKNPITADIHELAHELDVQSQINYLLEIQKPDTTQLNEAKVLVLGDERVGKTSLINRMFGWPMDDNQASTMGINIEPFKLGCGIKVNIWDFAGQEVTHQTHQFFLSARSLYLLVIDGQKEDDSSKTRYWLNTITATAGKEAPIVILANKMDLNPSFRFDLHRFKSEFNIVDVLYVSANDKKAKIKAQHNISDLKNTITAHVQGLRDISLKFPPSWLAVKQHLEHQQKQGVDFVEASQFDLICEQNGVKEDKLQQALLDVLNQIGTVVSYQEHKSLNLMQIINPLWVTEGVYKIIRAEQIGQNHAILTRAQYDEIFVDNAKYAKPRHYQWLEDLLKKFELAFSITDAEHNDYDKLLIPARLEPNQPDFDLTEFQQGLNFRFAYTDILKPHLISRFIVQMNSYTTNAKVKYWKRGVFLSHQKARAVVISDEDKNTITIAVNTSERDGKELLTIIRHCIRRINGEHLKVKEQVPVVEDGEVLDFVDYKLLLQAEEIKQATVLASVQGEYEKLNVAELIDGYRINDDTRFDSDKLLKDLLTISAQQTENRADIINESEDATNRRYRTALLGIKYNVADQSQGGQSATGKNAGERDLVIRNNETGVAEVIIEAQNIKTFNKNTIVEHYQRIAKYDTVGNSISVLLNYVKAPGFDSAVTKYQQLFDDYASVESEHSNIVMGESRLGKRRVRHYIVNFCAQ